MATIIVAGGTFEDVSTQHDSRLLELPTGAPSTVHLELPVARDDGDDLFETVDVDSLLLTEVSVAGIPCVKPVRGNPVVAGK